MPPFERVALLLGTEGHGVSPEVLAASDLVAEIPMADPNRSLNVHAAAAIAAWEVLRHIDR
jgi:tRNA G18 (ribose-2'-O)-methylase SpoU